MKIFIVQRRGINYPACAFVDRKEAEDYVSQHSENDLWPTFEIQETKINLEAYENDWGDTYYSET